MIDLRRIGIQNPITTAALLIAGSATGCQKEAICGCLCQTIFNTVFHISEFKSFRAVILDLIIIGLTLKIGYHTEHKIYVIDSIKALFITAIKILWLFGAFNIILTKITHGIDEWKETYLTRVCTQLEMASIERGCTLKDRKIYLTKVRGPRNIPLARVLIALGANINHKNSIHKTPLDLVYDNYYCTLINNPPLSQEFIQVYGEDYCTLVNTLPLSEEHKADYIKMINFLIKHGGQRSKTLSGPTPVHQIFFKRELSQIFNEIHLLGILCKFYSF